MCAIDRDVVSKTNLSQTHGPSRARHGRNATPARPQRMRMQAPHEAPTVRFESLPTGRCLSDGSEYSVALGPSQHARVTTEEMGMIRFVRFELRTTDVDAARAFYAQVLGDKPLDIVPLPAAALAHGAPAHWLGQIEVSDVEATASVFVAKGATRLGPSRANEGRLVAVLRDPFGAVVALTTASAPTRTGVVWHQLLTTDLAAALATYRDLFGWHAMDCLDLGNLGVHQEFAWHSGGESVGSLSETARLPGVHPHWLFHFHVSALEPALSAVRALGGVTLEPIVLPDGDRIAVCEDPQRAAFALRESRRRERYVS